MLANIYFLFYRSVNIVINECLWNRFTVTIVNNGYNKNNYKKSREIRSGEWGESVSFAQQNNKKRTNCFKVVRGQTFVAIIFYLYRYELLHSTKLVNFIVIKINGFACLVIILHLMCLYFIVRNFSLMFSFIFRYSWWKLNTFFELWNVVKNFVVFLLLAITSCDIALHPLNQANFWFKQL